MGSEHHTTDASLSVDGGGSVDQSECTSNAHSPATEGNGDQELIRNQEVPERLNKGVYVYRQDVVRSGKKEGLIGMVMEVGGDLDSDSSISDSEDDSDSNDLLLNGQVKVIWADHTETKDNADEIVVADRAFMHGDVVASASDPTGQTGTVVDVDIKVDLLAANGEIIKDISSRELLRVRDFTIGDYVLNGPWLGRVDEVLDNVTVMFDDGSACKVIKADPVRLAPVSTSLLEDAHFPYYPGQRVKSSSSSVFKNSRWISGSWKASRCEGTVVKVQAASVFVYWIASASTGYGSDSIAIPSDEQDPKNLKLLSCLSYANWQLGDWCLFPSHKHSATSVSLNGKHGGSFCSSDSQIKGIDDLLTTHVEDMGNGSSTEGSAVDSCDPGLAYTKPNPCDMVDKKFSELEINDQNGECSSSSIRLEPEDSDLTGHLGLHAATTGKLDENGNFDLRQSNSDSVEIGQKQKLDERNDSIGDNASDFGSCSSSLSVKKEPAHDNRLSHRKKLRKIVVKRDKRAKRKEEAFEKALLIANTVTKVDVIWQDGVRQNGIFSKDLIPIDDTGDHEFYPEQYVVEKTSNEDEDIPAVKRVGVVKSVDAKERTALVRWLKPASRPEDLREFDTEELVSVYELDQHPDYDYCYGDTVIRLSPIFGAAEVVSSGDLNGERHHQAGSEELCGKTETIDQSDQQQSGQVSEHENISHFDSVSWVGNVTGLKDGDIQVTWADGMVSMVGPQAVFVVGRDDDDDSSQANIEDGDDDAASWETVDSDDMNALENVDEENKEDGLQQAIEHDPEAAGVVVSPGEDMHGQTGGLSITLAALGFVTRIASGLFFRGRKQTDSLEPNNSDGIQSAENTSENFSVESADGAAGLDLDRNDSSDAPTFQQNGYDSLNCASDTNVFKHFDSATTPEDHYFLNENGQTACERKWAKKVQQEWCILEKNLPETIYVRVYEERMDLLRSVIVGAYGTPYQDGLFFFDFYLPQEYPLVPPLAYYHSGGLRINPNLYENGRVCLSLLNTWTGKGNEVWDPSSSSILQVLVSLQGLVLNSKPYFNEAGYDRQVGTAEGEKNSLSYNENSFLLSCKSMLYVLRRPPKNFEALVRDHFQKRGLYILKACDAYLKGAVVGSLTKDATVTERSNEQGSSVGFKLMLSKLLPRLFTALKEVGADCQQFEHLASKSNIER
ncbi:probable ubiquitin-conjugating enzyme E2 23 isoform X1 [Nymphaea colorata]|nr:probable ubiquitin-conjugating enzyme E2 23 isoform X1 [Nymphaea colorata]XP_031476147.1 probable ubiquitin-conjugating enzyme E2 23 isoform X1 [Nymphaea colorata]